MNFHVGAKLPGLNLRVQAFGLLHKVVVKPAPVLRVGCAAEPGPVATAGVRRQCELAYQQQAACSALAIHVLHAVVHLAGRIAEDAQFQQFGNQLVALCPAVARLGTDQHHEAGANLANGLPVHVHMRFTDALQQRHHA